ncbi:gluconate transport inducer 1/Pac2, partial [Fusarium avenaceum]
TYHGFINTTLDASIIFENTFTGRCNHVPRRPHDRERQDLIKSGNVFIYEEHASGIKRWTDSLSWSPSRILGNFLIYRELERPFPPGEKKHQHPRTSTSLPTGMEVRRNNTPIDEIERSLVGSLVDSYDFKPGGLIKKTISITYQGVPHHLVSYYSVEDVRSGRLLAPSMHPVLKGTIPRTELLTQQNFRSPI